jgi:CBS domain-containing protein
MKAKDIMTTDVVSVHPDTPIPAVAKLLSARGISAVPVIDGAGAPVGMVSEGDLIGRNDSDRRARRDWWLTLLAEGGQLHPDFLASLREPSQAARDVMSSPVVTVGVDTELADIAQLLVMHHIKRVPVIEDGRVVGIVSRADLVRAMAAAKPQTVVPSAGGLFAQAIKGIEDQFASVRGKHTKGAVVEATRPIPNENSLTVADFRALMADHDRRETGHKTAEQDAHAAERRRHVTELIDQHISEENWRQLIHGARLAAEQGAREFQLLRFPSALCSDGGRAINSEQPGWPQTLRGEAAELYLRWERDLKPQGFPISAQDLDFPGGMPGDIGLFLDWAA